MTEKTTFTVTLTEEHPDGSATFTLNGTPEAMKHLMESMVQQSIVNGVSMAENSAEQFVYQANLRKAAEYLINCLDRYMALGQRHDKLELDIARDQLNTLLLQCSKVGGKL